MKLEKDLKLSCIKMQAIKEALGKFIPESGTVIPYKRKHVEAYVDWFTGKDQSPDFSTGENGF